MKDDTQMYFVTEVGSFGSMDAFSESDPTMEAVNGKKKKKQTMEELIKEATETNRKNLIK